MEEPGIYIRVFRLCPQLALNEEAFLFLAVLMCEFVSWVGTFPPPNLAFNLGVSLSFIELAQNFKARMFPSVLFAS